MATTKTKSDQWFFQRERIFLLLALLAFSLFPTMQAIFMESRTYRDLMQLTPFYDVRITRIDVRPDGSLIVAGLFTKSRDCDLLSTSAYVEAEDKVYPVEIKRPDGAGAASRNRPPLEFPQVWGPWLLEPPVPNPERWYAFSRHACPNEAVPQQNYFAGGEWPHLNGETEQ